jgi:hypothetical protein
MLPLELEALGKADEERAARSAALRRRVLIGLLLALIALTLLWSTGRMDAALSRIGLNKNECIKNAFGATDCGDDAKKYRRSVEDALAGPSTDATSLKRELRVAIPSAEAYYADHGSYTGMTIAGLRRIDPEISPDVSVGLARANYYCLQVGFGVNTYSLTRPGDFWYPGSCSAH